MPENHINLKKIIHHLTFLFVVLSITIFSCKKKLDISSYKPILPTPEKSIFKNVVYGTDTIQQSMDVYLPENRDSLNTPIVITIHGGAWYMGDKTDLDCYGFDTFFNANGCALININYRLDNNFKFPAQIQDVMSAIKYIANKSSGWKINSGRICLFGGSSGAQLALLAAYTYNQEERIKVVLDFSGPTNFIQCFKDGLLVDALPKFLGTYNTSATLWHDASPIFNLKNALPTCIIHGSSDSIIYLSQSKMLHDSLDVYKVPNMFIPVLNEGHVISFEVWEQLQQPVMSWIKNYL